MKHLSGQLATLKDLRIWRASIGGSADCVAVVCGTFHILQPGNLTALQLARQYAKHVCVVLEPDTARSRSSGSRPFISLSERAEMLSHLKDVDLVTSFSPHNAAAYLQILKPYTWFRCNKQTDGPLSRHASILADRKEAIPVLPACFTPDVLKAIRAGKTPICLPGSFRTGRHNVISKSTDHTLVTVNGCFDVLHIGHLRFLAQARAMGDELMVLTNNDASVQRYKGTDRPVFPLRFRTAALLAMKSVSAVRSFSEDNPLRLISTLKPGIHVKGGSYEPGRVDDERRLLESWGGQIAFCPMVEGRSTSSYLHKL
ncbi:MAG: adenylyltransferase/cytidyltransferase family protein [bacterium]